MTSKFICPDAFISPLVIEDAVYRALDEDLGRAGDVTSIATVPQGTRGRAVVVARQAGTIEPGHLTQRTEHGRDGPRSRA